jgi:tetratricopeptide (TPR) repeat protein
MDAYDIPDELSNLQSQDMSKIGFMQDILRGVRKILDAGKQAEKAPAPAAAVAAVAVDSIERLVKNGNTLLKLNNRAGAQDIFNTATKEYPDDYRGWLGLARCATANFTAPAENEAAVNMWLGYVKQLANENEFAVVEKEIVEYMKKMAENDADNDMGTVNYIINDIQTTQISSLVTQKEQIEKNMECRKQEYHREIADDEITFDSMANTSRQKKKLRVVIGSLIGVVLLIAIMVDVELFAGLIIILMFIVIPFALLYHFIKNRNRVQQRDEDEITIIAIGREKRKNYEKAIAIFNEHINALNTEIKRAETRIACCQKYISADKTKIAEMFLAQRCAKIGIQRQYDEALAKLRSAASDPNGQFEEFVEKSEDGVEAEESFESFPRREWGLNQRAKFHLGS